VTENTQPGYIVALRYTEAAGGYAGITTWSVFASKSEFDTWYDEATRKDQAVVEEGITKERAVELCQRTPLRSYVRAALADARNPDTGEINSDIARMKLASVMLVVGPRLLTNR
jgi:hypothetical protein